MQEEHSLWTCLQTVMLWLSMKKVESEFSVPRYWKKILMENLYKIICGPVRSEDSYRMYISEFYFEKNIDLKAV